MTAQEIIKRLKEVRRFDFCSEDEFGYRDREYSYNGDYIDAEDIDAIIRGLEASISTSKEIEADGGEGVMSSHWHKNDY